MTRRVQVGWLSSAGHQAVGRVEKLGAEVLGWKVGDRALVAWLASPAARVDSANYTRTDAREFLELAAAIPIRTTIQTFQLADGNDAVRRLATGELEATAVLVTGEQERFQGTSRRFDWLGQIASGIDGLFPVSWSISLVRPSRA